MTTLALGQVLRCRSRRGVLRFPDQLLSIWNDIDVFETETPDLWLWGSGKTPIKYPKTAFPLEVVVPRPLEVADSFWLMIDGEDGVQVYRLVVERYDLVATSYEVKYELRVASQVGLDTEPRAKPRPVLVQEEQYWYSEDVPAEKPAPAPAPVPEPPARPGGRKVEWD